MVAQGGSRWRHPLSVLCLVLCGLLLPIGLLAGWANATFFDSDTFSKRAVDLLDSPAVRRELADKLTAQLAEAGNQQAVNFRPAFQLAIEAAIDTDTFQSIFRTAVRQTHEAVLAGQKNATLNLSQSISIISGTLQLPQNARPGQPDERTLGTSLGDVTKELAKYRVWSLQDDTALLLLAGFGGAVLTAGLAIGLSGRRRKTVRTVGFVVVADGLAITALVLGAEWYVGTLTSSQELANALRDAVSHGLADLRALGLWTAVYGVVMAAAARPKGSARFTPARASEAVTGWVERRRRTTAGTVGLSVVAIVAGLMLIANPWFWLRLGVLATGLWLAYFGVTELVNLAQLKVPAAIPEGAGALESRRPRRVALVGAVIAVVMLLVTGGLIFSTSRAANEAEASGELVCNGDASLCDLPLNLAMFPATHNSMSSALYPNWLLAEHVKTISGQLNSGIRALLFDTHYGVPSSARFPGSSQPLIITDRAAELRDPTGESAQVDRTVADRAAQVAAGAPRAAEAQRGIYLCHVYCELGAFPFAEGLREIKTFLDSHPDDVVMTVIEDATTPAETAAAIVKAGLGDRVYTLDPNKPLPTIGDMIRSRRTLLVFAEGGVGAGAPPWYHRAYEGWFQETPYTWDHPEQMNCAPNRGTADAPLFLVNHWLSADPPNPNRTAGVNKRSFLEDRLRTCLKERNQLPNVIAVDFSERGDVVGTARDVNRELVDQVRSARRGGKPQSSAPGTGAPVTPPTLPGGTSSASEPLVPAPTKVGALTGGDPAAFCERAPDVLTVVGGWALATVSAPGTAKGLPDLAYGPAAARSLGAVRPVAPRELADLMAPAHQRADEVVTALRALGLDQAAIDELADLAERSLNSPDNPDPVAVQTTVLDRLGAMIGPDRMKTAAQEFAASHPGLPHIFDFGEVTDEVARAAGYECIADI